MAHSLLLVVRNTQRLYCYHICLLRQIQSPWKKPQPGLHAVSRRLWIHYKLQEIFETHTGSIYFKKWQGLTIVIKGLGFNGKNLWCISISTPSLPFPPKGPRSIPSPTMSSSLPQHIEGALQLTFSLRTWRITNNCQTNKEKCSSFWETAKRLQYSLGNDSSF